jgi:hypothetical protein
MLQKVDFVDIFGGPEECVGRSFAVSPIYWFLTGFKNRTQRSAVRLIVTNVIHAGFNFIFVHSKHLYLIIVGVSYRRYSTYSLDFNSLYRYTLMIFFFIIYDK